MLALSVMTVVIVQDEKINPGSDDGGQKPKAEAMVYVHKVPQ